MPERRRSARAADGGQPSVAQGGHAGQPAGRRTSARAAARRRARRRFALLAGVVLLLGAVGAFVLLAPSAEPLRDQLLEAVGGTGDDDQPSAAPDEAPPGDPELPPLRHLLLAVIDDADRQALAAVLLVADPASENATLVLLPTTAVVDQPGEGPGHLAAIAAEGAGPLAGAVTRLLGVVPDLTVVADRDAMAAALDVLGQVRVEVSSTLHAPAAVTLGDDPETVGAAVLEEGERIVGGDGLIDHATGRTVGSTALDSLPRLQQVLLGLLDHLEANRDDPLRVARRVLTGARIDTDGYEGLLDEQAADELAPRVADVLALLASRRADGELATMSLPVTSDPVHGDGWYRGDVARIDGLLRERFADAPRAGPAPGRSVRILNGSGVPRVGSQAAELLGDRFRVVQTGNADRFTYETTRILVNEDDPASMEAARDVRAHLGVGEIGVAPTPSPVSELTIIVGADLPFPSD